MSVMSTWYERLTDSQIQLILNGVRNDVDYHIIAEQAGLGHKRRVTDFLQYRMIEQFTAQKRARQMEIGQ